MAVIHGYVETYMMKKDALSKEEHEQYLHAILHNTERLNKLVNDLFELSKLEAKQVTLHKEPMMINELLEEICTQFSMLAKKNQIDLITEIPRKMVPIVADSHLIGRAMQNLLDNALKYTQPRGRVQLTASVLGEKLEIVLTNSGTGISAEDIPHVFDRYYKANNASSVQSTGLGLAITKKIIDLHFGEILVMSVPGQQTRFSVFLPIGHQEGNIN
jgi:signal transduction histidine kinase